MVTGNVLISLLVTLISSIYIFALSTLVGLLSLSSILLFAFIAWRFQPRILNKQKEVMSAHSANETQYIDTLTGIKTIKSYSKETVYNDRINTVYETYQSRGYELMIIGNRLDFFTQLVTGLYITSIFALGVWQVVNIQLRLGELMGIVTVTGSMIPSLASLMMASIQLQEAKVAFNRMHELVKLEPEKCLASKNGLLDLTPTGTLTITGMTFRYPGCRTLFRDISLAIPRGKMVTLFGEVGSGKSTLVDILQSFYTPEAGNIALDGKRHSDFSLNQWRSMISVVSQKEKIFNTTIIDNICLSNDLNEIQQCVEYLKEYNLSNYFNQLPQGVMTLCGEEGNNLSGGQKQLVGIVRALYKQPEFLLLDEATSAMDQQTESQIVELLQEIGKEKNMGILLITHRLSLAMQSETIFLLKNGAIEASGSHTQLINQNNSYSKSYRLLIKLERQSMNHKT
jgi:ATP-binding cassette subfamily B protein